MSLLHCHHPPRTLSNRLVLSF